eukprot:gnl/Hemi2/25762_TR8664_c0_g1_i1.p1 gnl/Hemi2/25762_TR8664_c0_g1~~gnl/Hemi2/25762_TR8664_c0_g1_i1.p1  ORF type:complete len:432 (-),score=113.44 gnl/Hemi2/25762_TR8664_c0_g1_i1:62-1357(-)
MTALQGRDRPSQSEDEAYEEFIQQAFREEQATTALSDVVVSLENVHKTYLLGVEGVPALRGVSVQIHRGEFVALYGTSGGGKTSLLNIVGTIDKPTKGKVDICGARISHRTKDQDLAALRLNKIGFVFQTFNLLSSLTALENVMLPMVLQGRLSPSKRRERAIALLTRMGMEHRVDHFPSMLSGGEQQRVTIARSLANNPELLLLDEPTGDLDTKNTRIVMKLLLELHREGHTLVMVTHDVSLKNFATRVLYLRDGKLQKVENVAESTRQVAIASLQESIDNNASDLCTAALSRAPKPSMLSSSSSSSPSSSSAAFNLSHCAMTEVRRPTEYSTFAFAKLLAGSTPANTTSPPASALQDSAPPSLLLSHSLLSTAARSSAGGGGGGTPKSKSQTSQSSTASSISDSEGDVVLVNIAQSSSLGHVAIDIPSK